MGLIRIKNIDFIFCREFVYVKEHNLPVVIVRPFNVYGPRQIGEGAIRTIVLRAITQQPITLFQDGTQIRSWCFIDDLVEGVLRCLSGPGAVGEVFNLGNPQEYSILDFAKLIITLTASNSTIEYRSLPQDDPKVRKPDISLARKLLDWQPQVEVKQGLGKTIEYFKAVIKDENV